MRHLVGTLALCWLLANNVSRQDAVPQKTPVAETKTEATDKSQDEVQKFAIKVKLNGNLATVTDEHGVTKTMPLGEWQRGFGINQSGLGAMDLLKPIVIEGALYTVIGGRVVPMPGGGASGCFEPNNSATEARIRRAQAEYTNRLQREKEDAAQPLKKD